MTPEDRTVTGTIRMLAAPGQVTEVRAITDDGIASGYFDSAEALAVKVDPLDAIPTVQGIYITLNPVDPALFSRRANRIKMRLGVKDATTADSDILRRRWLPIDIDPVRPSGVSSTDAEHAAALTTARKVAAFLTEQGFPAPILADSGNGAHLLYRIDLPNDDASKVLVKHCLEILDTICGDRTATVDTANYNAARIWKLYGTMSRKGDNTTTRPHRRSAILEAPIEPVIVGKDLLEQLAEALPEKPVPEPNTKHTGKTPDLRQWFPEHDIAIHSEKPYAGGTIYTLAQCPFSTAHADGAYAIQFGNGAIFAGCHHTTCGRGKQRWQELREMYEPSGEKCGCRHDAPLTIPPRLPPGAPPVPIVTDLPDREAAETIRRTGNPKQEMLRVFALDHEGDKTVAECLILSLASRAVLNTNGLHVSVTGESGKGKSHAFATMLRQVPDRFRLDGAMSNKALFYIDELQTGSVIVFDDTSMSEDMGEVLKGVTSSFKKPFIYRTVNKDRKGVNCTIPARCVWWMAKVEGSGDDQVFNRMLTCWIDDSAKQDDRVLTRVLMDSAERPDHGMEERPEVQVCQAIWEQVGQDLLHVIIPYATRIRFQVMDNRRNPGMLLDLVKANAVLMAKQREREDINGVPCITATLEDFEAAVRLYGLLCGSEGGQGTKLTRKESALLEVIEQSGWNEFTIAQLQTVTGYTNGGIHRTVHGYMSRGVTYSGLLEKCPAIAYCDRTVATEDDPPGVSMRRRTNAYTFDRALYRQWRVGGSVWLEGEPHPADEPARPDPDGDGERPAANKTQIQQKPQKTQKISPAVQQLSSNSPTTAGEEEVDANRPDCKNNNNNTHLDLSDQVLSSKSENTRLPSSPGIPTETCDGDCAIAGEVDPKSPEPRPNTDSTPPAPPLPLQHVLERCSERGVFAGEVPVSPTGNSSPARRKVHAVDYKPLEVREPQVPCSVCGKKGSFYVEKLTAERRSRPPDEQRARRLCRRCYDAAVCHDRAAAPPLPGMIDLALLLRHAPNIGKCPVCRCSPATYVSEATGVKLCEACYVREVQRQCRASGVVV